MAKLPNTQGLKAEEDVKNFLSQLVKALTVGDSELNSRLLKIEAALRKGGLL